MATRRPPARVPLLVLAGLLAAGVLVPARAAQPIRIVRDRFGVPHVFGRTALDVAYGAGYALAEDRLWQMHVFRRIAKGRLSELLGVVDILGLASTVEVDQEVRFFTYTAAERARRLATYPPEIRAALQAFADGINRRIREVQLDPRKLPFEFVAYGVPLIEPWTVDDTVALQDVLILAFGSGGGNELAQAALLAELVRRHGPDLGRRMFDDLVVTEDPDGPITIPRGFDYASAPTFGRDEESEGRRALTADARLSLRAGAETRGTPARASTDRILPAARGTLAQLRLIPDVRPALEAARRLERFRRALEAVFTFGSNAQIVGPALTETGNAAQTAGPQVGYLLPQWLADVGLHAADGTLDAVGMTFAGAGPAVLIGRGRGYAWTTTTGASDLTDTYVERLNPANPRQYLFEGRYEDMDCRTERYAFRDLVPIATQEICRTRHGPVVAFDEANGVAYALRYAWFDREGQTVEGFFSYNRARSVEDFATFANFLSSNHNMFYVDDHGHYGYWHPGNHPVRAAGVDLRLPQDGTGGSEWQGLVPVEKVPHAVDFPRGWLANWNNQPAEGWKRERGWPAIDNAADLERALDPTLDPVPDPRTGRPINPDRRIGFEDLSANLRYAAFRQHDDVYFRRFVPAESALSSARAREARQALLAWDGFLTDRDGDGLEDSAGPTILRAWIEAMRTLAFGDELGDLAGWATSSLLWHVLAPDDRLALGVEWLGGEAPEAFAARAFERAVAGLAAERGGAPASWRSPAEREHYQRLNADLVADTALGALGLDTSGDSGLPGDVPDHIAMDRGTYNHVVVYLDPPAASGPPGAARVRAGSVIPPGQSGFIDLLGREDRHYEDQLPLYVGWRYKPMPMTLAEARAVAESERTLSR
jgi:penicillin amidase